MSDKTKNLPNLTSDSSQEHEKQNVKYPVDFDNLSKDYDENIFF